MSTETTPSINKEIRRFLKGHHEGVLIPVPCQSEGLTSCIINWQDFGNYYGKEEDGSKEVAVPVSAECQMGGDDDLDFDTQIRSLADYSLLFAVPIDSSGVCFSRREKDNLLLWQAEAMRQAQEAYAWGAVDDFDNPLSTNEPEDDDDEDDDEKTSEKTSEKIAELSVVLAKNSGQPRLSR